jgi:hypothetical protein
MSVVPYPVCLQTALSESSARLGELATQVQLAGVASVVEEMQNVQRDTLAEISTLKVGS